MNLERIRKKAYERYEWRTHNGMPGNEKGDWAWAEDELKMEEVNLKYVYLHYPEVNDGTDS